MSDLNEVKGFIARGDKETAVVQLASILMENRHDVEAWLLLGEIIDDPAKKKDCYHWVLRLSPDNVLALARLQELEPPPSRPQSTSSKNAQTGTKSSSNELRQNSNYIPDPNAYPTFNDTKDEPEIIIYFIMGILAILVILYVVVTGNFSAYSNILCGGLIFLGLSTVMIISFVINKYRG
jgi:hypothetical protein